MCMFAGLCTVALAGEIKRWQREWNQLFPFNYKWGRLIEIPLQVFSVWVPGDNPWCTADWAWKWTPFGAMGNGSLSFWAGNRCEIYWRGLWMFLRPPANVSSRSSPVLVFSVCACLTASARMTGTAPRMWGITAGGGRDLTKEGMEICLFIFFL